MAYLLVLLLGVTAYITSLNYGFSQDDFIHLSASKASSVKDFINFFNPLYQYPDIFFYRPLTTYVYFFINSFFFGLNSLIFHTEALGLHLINSILFFMIIQKIWQNKTIALISTLFFTVSAAHFLSLYYISAFQQIGRTFFIFLAILLFFKYQESKRKIFYTGSLLAFVAALLSKETGIILPFLFFPLEILRRRSDKLTGVIQETIKLTIPFVAIAIFYVAIRFVGLQSVFGQGSYNTTFSIMDILQNLKWYIIWSFGLPEILETYPSLKPSSLFQFGKDLPLGYLVVILSILVGIIVALLLPGIKRLSKRVLVLSLIIFLIPIVPVLVLNQHRYPHYLDVAFVGFLPILAWLFYQQTTLKRMLGTIGIIAFVALQFLSIRLSEQTHWTTHRAKIADNYYEDFKSTYPTIQDNTTVVFLGTDKSVYELSISLAKHYGLSVWYPGKIKDVKYRTSEAVDIGDSGIVITYPITAY